MLRHSSKNSNGTSLLIFIGWIVYMTSYIGRLNYSANITEIIDFYGVGKSEAGLAPTFYFFAYGMGQVINGMLCQKYNIKWVIFSSLFTSGMINLYIAFSTNFQIIKWLWLINGFALSILWPTLIRLLSENLPKRDLSKSSVIMGTTVAIGTIIIYSLSSVYVAFDKFKLAFYTAAFCLLIVSLLWLILYKMAVNFSLKEKNDEEAERLKNNIAGSNVGTLRNVKNKIQLKSEKKALITSICVICFFAIGVNLTKDGLTTWVPSILKDEYNVTDSISILLTLFLPIVAIFGNLFAVKLHIKIPNYIIHCLSVFTAIAIFIGSIILSLEFSLVFVMFISLIIVSFLASSLNSLITSVYPMFMREKLNSGRIAGILNGFCCVGSTISSYVLGFIAENSGWSAVFYTLLGYCLLAIIVGFFYLILTHIHSRHS